MTLADEDTNSILTDNANRAIQGNVAMQIIQSDYQEIRTCICERNAKLILRNTGNLKLTNRRASHSRLSSQREQSLSTCVLILVSFKEVGHVHAHL